MSSEDIKTLGRQLRHIEDPRARSLFERIISNIDEIKSSIAAVEVPVLPGWQDAVLENGWGRFSDSFNPPQFTKTSDGVVYIRGLISGGTSTPGTTLLTLPEGYRPEFSCVFAGETSPTSHARADANPDGTITIQSGSSTYFTLDVIRFVAYR